MRPRLVSLGCSVQYIPAILAIMPRIAVPYVMAMPIIQRVFFCHLCAQLGKSAIHMVPEPDLLTFNFYKGFPYIVHFSL